MTNRPQLPSGGDHQPIRFQMNDLNIPAELADVPVGALSHDQLVELIEAQAEGGIRLAFSGKRVARQLARRARPRTLRTIGKYGFGDADERSRNLLVEGDNLQALVTLYKYRGQVDLIVTDPPYNTGNDFRYNDRWDDDPNDDGIGDLVPVDDVARHTKWLKFMWPRLQMMKAMLKPGGVLAICIDHRELFRLGQMLDELFGEANRLAIINWQKMAGVKNQDTGVSTATEYVLVYARDEARARTRKVSRSETTAGAYRNPDDDERGAWAPSDSTLMGASTHPGQVYAIQNPFTGRLHYPQEGRCWRNERAKMKAAVEAWGVEYEDRLLDDGLHPALVIKGAKLLDRGVEGDQVLVATRDTALRRRESGPWPQFFWRSDRQRRPGEGELRYKTFLADVQEGVVPTTFWAADDFEPIEIESTSWAAEQSGTSDVGLKELNSVVGRGHGFTTVKPLALMQKIISIWSPPDGLVVDPFAGSGTTGHAVLDLNQSAGTSRRFILIEQGRPENGDAYARTLTADRLRRVMSGKWKSGTRDPLGGGFTYKRLTAAIDGAAVMRMVRADMRDTVIFAHFNDQRRRDALVPVEDDGYTYLVAKNADNEGFFLVWDGPNKNTDLTKQVYSSIVAEARRANLVVGRYHVYARRWVYQRASTTSFYQIPDHILASFGLDIRNEPFASEDLD